jgi:hypothetical protein
VSEPLPEWPTAEDRGALLQRFRPEVVYDSREAFPAASVSEMLDDPWVTLRRADGTPIAVPGPGESDLSTGFFTTAGYRNGEHYAAGDHISFPEAHHDYRAQAREMERQHPEMADVVYGHLAQDSTPANRFWVQYWFFMLYNDAQLLGRFGLHEGDWEMVQFRLVGTGPTWNDPQIDLAVYAQHTYAQQADVNQLDTSPEGAPVAFSALGSHAHYFQRGIFKTEGLWDVADGDGPRVRQTLVDLDQDPPGWLWWPGMWGGTTPSIAAIESSSPTGPRQHAQWHDPNYLAVRVRPIQPASPLRVRTIATSRAPDNRPQIDFDFEDIDEPAGFPGTLVATISPVGDQAETETVAVVVDQLLSGSLKLRRSLDANLDYEVSVVWVDGTGARSKAFDSRLGRVPMGDDSLLDRALYALRWLLRRVTAKTR